MFRAHVLETCRGMKLKLIVKQILCIKLVKYWDKFSVTLFDLHAGIPTGYFQTTIQKFTSSCMYEYTKYVLVYVCVCAFM